MSEEKGERGTERNGGNEWILETVRREGGRERSGGNQSCGEREGRAAWSVTSPQRMRDIRSPPRVWMMHLNQWAKISSCLL